MPHPVRSALPEYATRADISAVQSWATASTGGLFDAIADGHAAALGELFRRDGTVAVGVTLRSLLAAGDDEAAMASFLRRAVASEQARGVDGLTRPRREGRRGRASGVVASGR